MKTSVARYAGFMFGSDGMSKHLSLRYLAASDCIRLVFDYYTTEPWRAYNPPPVRMTPSPPPLGAAWSAPPIGARAELPISVYSRRN